MWLGVTRASRAQVKVTFYLENGLFSEEQPCVPRSAVTSLPVSVSSIASFPARPCSVGDAERELVSPLIYASTFLLVLNLIIGDMKTTLRPGWLVSAGTYTTSPTGFEVPGDLGHFFQSRIAL